MKQKIFYTSVILLLSSLFFSCSQGGESKEGQKPSLVATTGMIADGMQEIVGEEFEVIGLMGPGVDPHLYKATRSDLTKLRKASVICYNGLHLEGKMGEILEKVGLNKPVIALGEGIPKDQLIYHGENQDSQDPHIWFDVSLWMKALSHATKELKDIYPEKADLFQQNLNTYLDSLAQLDSRAREALATIPPQQRVLITAHDAFSYFGEAYDVEVRGLQGISTVSEFGLKDIKDLVDFIVERNIKAVFVESSIPSKSLEAVVSGCQDRGHEIEIGGTLYSDAMGDKGSDAGTYPGMVRTNVRTIVEALR